jgi:hypothetical protein
MFLAVVAVGITISGSYMMRAHRANEQTFILAGQAGQFARSGLTEALSWFRLQPSQPVQVFKPVLDKTADPQLLDTDDPEVGLVRNFPVNGAFWGRYEVWKQWDADPDAERRAWRQKMQVKDVSALRNDPQSGSVWRLKCIGYVFRRVDPNKAFDEAPNHVLSTEVLETEIRRLNLTPPGAAALLVEDGANVTIKGKGEVNGGGKGAGVGYKQGKTSPPGKALGRLKGNPASSPNPDYDASVEKVFGMKNNELRGMADVSVTKESDFPSPIPNNSIIYSDVPFLTLDSGQPLSGFGVVYHTGNLTLQPGNSSNFSGLLYVNGDLLVTAPAELKGTVIVTGTATVEGTGDVAALMYDPEVLSVLQARFGQYRFSTPVRHIDR